MPGSVPKRPARACAYGAVRTSRPGAKESKQGVDVSVLRVHHDLIQAKPNEESTTSGVVRRYTRGEGSAYGRMGRIDFDAPARLGIFEPSETD